MNYRESLSQLLRPINPKIGAEIGVHKGALSEFVLGLFPELTLHMVDPYSEHPEYPNQSDNKSLALKRTLRFGKRARKIYGSSEYASEMIQQSGIELDYVFIDADHSYESVLDDMNLWYPLVRRGGLFCGHDFGKPDKPGVSKAVDEWSDVNNIPFDVAEGHIWLVVK